MQYAFLEKVRQLFFEDHKIDPKLKGDDLLSRVTEVVSTITSGKSIRELFSRASDVLILETENHKIYDLNTTALCMLHRNRPEIAQALGKPLSEIYNHACMKVPRKDSDFNDYPFLSNHYFHFYEFLHWHRSKNPSKFIYPNTLITSDAFIKSRTEVEQFIKKYESYLDDIWLFQVPHHGSDKSSNRKFLNCFRRWQYSFINYATGNGHGHPHPETIINLTAAGHAANFVPITEFSGLRFGCHIE